MNRLSHLRRQGAAWLAAGSALALLLVVGSLSFADGQAPAESSGKSPVKKEARPRSPAEAIKLVASVLPETVRRGDTFKLTITGTPKPGWHTFPMTKQLPKKEDFKSELIALEMPEGLKLVGGLIETEPQEVDDDGRVYEHIKPFTWSQEFAVLPEAKPGPGDVTIKVRMQACDERACLPPEKITLHAKLDISAEEPVQLREDVRNKLANPTLATNTAPPPPPSSPTSVSMPEIVGSPNAGLVAFILQGVFWGFVSLITPCVFPMIPITVSFFLKQSEKEHHRPITMALVYCATIIVVLTVAALALLSLFRELSTNPIMNFAIGALFIFFALSLFGMYEIELPSGLARFTSAREGRGGLIGTMFMALTFTIISFACVAPFLGGFGGAAVDSHITFTHRLLGGLAFAATFASPFFILALFPTLLKKMPKSGSWLNTVKVVMGFLELAAALKFLRTGELVSLPKPALFTYDLVLGLYIALALLCGLYLLGVYRLPHDSPAEHLTVPRLLFSLLFLGLAFYLTPALFKVGDKGQSQRPAGTVFAWLDSFLLPDDQHTELPWVANLQKGLEKARAEKKLVFVDFTGVSCTNCKLNERDVFSQAPVQDLLKKYSLVALYTDKVPEKYYDAAEVAKSGGLTIARQREDAETNLEFQKSFGTIQLPLYVILEPLSGGEYRVVGKYDEGRIINQEAFKQFLRAPLPMAANQAPAQGSTKTAAAQEMNPPSVVAQRDAAVKLQPAAP